MATEKARVYLHGRFPAGERVGIYEVAGPEVQRHEGAECLATAVMDDDQRVEFSKGIVRGGYYLIFGYVDGQPVTVRARGKVDGDQEDVIAQPPVRSDPQTFRVDGQAQPAFPRVEEGQAAPAPSLDGGGELRGEALHERAAELDIEGRSGMSADQLREAVKAAESDAEAAQS